jgi:methionine-rich copper-binding protein CopC
MAVSLQKLPAGTYHVSWQAVATDTHRTAGTFDFTIQ